jgi:NTP pyrophosphatase (non-canonical NTP hydrolase)
MPQLMNCAAFACSREALDLSRLREVQARFDATHGIDRPWDRPITAETLDVLEHLVVCLAGELGEFANEVKKVIRGDSRYEAALPALKEELADIFIYVLKLGNQMSIDLEAEYFKKLRTNEERFRHFERSEE